MMMKSYGTLSKNNRKYKREERLANGLREEREMTLRELDLKVRERQVMIEEQASTLQLIETKHKLKLEMLTMQEKVTVDVAVGTVGVRSSKLPSFDEVKDEMDSYLRRFERYASAQKWKKDIWATNFSALLKGRALDVYARLPIDIA